jgi:hypothetical protein
MIDFQVKTLEGIIMMMTVRLLIGALEPLSPLGGILQLNLPSLVYIPAYFFEREEDCF